MIRRVETSDNPKNPEKGVVGSLGFEPRTASARPNCKNNGISASDLRMENKKNVLELFEDYLVLERGLFEGTARDYIRTIQYILKHTSLNDPSEIKSFLRWVKGSKSPSRYSNILKALRHFTRFIGRPELASSYAFPHPPPEPKRIFSKEELKRFYEAIPSYKMKAFFLVAASSGLRKGELLSLKFSDVDFSKRMLKPNCHKGSSKKSWVSFFNREAEEILKLHLQKTNKRGPKSDRIFPFNTVSFKKEWKIARDKSGVDLKVKDLRDWFCQTMGELGVPDRYVDAFCGRVPKSILARHYTDFSPEKLKEIYDKANFKVLI
jgi:integrase